jgi:cellulose synthase/poly-beta-1,6-N-acetylglucosamine synthase-like glycosyltransferase
LSVSWKQYSGPLDSIFLSLMINLFFVEAIVFSRIQWLMLELILSGYIRLGTFPLLIVERFWNENKWFEVVAWSGGKN